MQLCFATSQSEARRVQQALFALQLDRVLPDEAAEIAKVHDIASPDAQTKLLKDIIRIRIDFLTAPKHQSETRRWTVPRGRGSWKRARRRLRALAKKLTLLESPLREMADDPVMLGATAFVDPQSRLPQLVGALLSLTRIVQAAAELEGTRGNKHIEPWKNEATAACQQFWREHMHHEPRAGFTDHDTTEPANKFSRWFCNVMDVVAKVPVSECRTLLRHKRSEPSRRELRRRLKMRGLG